jgi:hypothetical protein
MLPSLRKAVTCAALIAATFGALARLNAQQGVSPPDYSSLQVRSFAPVKDAKTGFLIGGKNETALIAGLKEINGRPIADLERDMRPGAYANKGFIGPDERLLDVLAADNKYVVEQLRLTHQDLAKHLRAIGEAAGKTGGEFVYRGRKLKANLQVSRWWQASPFKDGTQTNSYVSVQDAHRGLKLEYSLLLCDLVERYGFYEGKGTPYRLDPRKIVEFFDLEQGAGKP